MLLGFRLELKRLMRIASKQITSNTVIVTSAIAILLTLVALIEFQIQTTLVY